MDDQDVPQPLPCGAWGGCVDGFIACVSLLPQKKIAIVELTNNSSSGRPFTEYITHTIFDRLLGVELSKTSPRTAINVPDAAERV